MATASQPEPEVRPALPAPPVARPSIVTCPSCGTQYNAETSELVHDTKLREKIRALEQDVEAWRANYQNVDANAKVRIEQLEARIAELTAQPEPESRRDREFFVA